MPNIEEIIGDLLADGAIRPGAFGLKSIEVRYYGSCSPSEFSPCEHDDETSNLWTTTYVDPSPDGAANYTHDDDPSACQNMWQTNDHGPEGIGGWYAAGGSFSYFGDDRELSEHLINTAIQIHKEIAPPRAIPSHKQFRYAIPGDVVICDGRYTPVTAVDRYAPGDPHGGPIHSEYHAVRLTTARGYRWAGWKS